VSTAAIFSPASLTVRCIAERKGDQWQAFSLEFGLAAQGDSLPEVKQKLDSMIQNFVSDALIGVDREHAHELLTRKATWRVFFKYYVLASLSRITGLLDSKDHKFYRERLALEPKAWPV
jgi:hypothetical protein